ncbi:MAG TPA: hypothetical protein VGN93_30340 [Shinella sp.]|jgi:hypothetical protein|uniref:hypothetical protein n=1 Tax=Shinella sp. TaxID=1870904 RepID=UPI002E140D8F|nr:hypothetical protein [Shinella sp.]
MRYLALVFLFPSLAFAQSCDPWSAGMSEEEEGRIMMASVCQAAGGKNHDLFLKCGADGELSLRFLVQAADFPPGDGPEFSSPLRLTVDGEAFDRPAHHEAMDNAMVSDFPVKGPLVERLKAGKTLTVAYPETKLPPVAFPLKGSKAAIDTLLAACTGS